METYFKRIRLLQPVGTDFLFNGNDILSFIFSLKPLLPLEGNQILILLVKTVFFNFFRHYLNGSNLPNISGSRMNTLLSEYNLISLGFLFSSKLIIMKESYVSIIFLIISGSSLGRKFNKISHGAETRDNIFI